MTRALIIGAGIGGAVAAMGLEKISVEPVVYESYPTGADDVGAWLSLMINGLAKGPRNTQDWLTGHHIEWDTPVTQLPVREPGR